MEQIRDQIETLENNLTNMVKMQLKDFSEKIESDFSRNGTTIDENLARNSRIRSDNNLESLTEKKFTLRNSLLTDLFKVNHIRSLYNLALAILIVVICRTLLNDYLEEGSLNFKFEAIVWALGKLHVVGALCFGMFCSAAFIAYPCLRYWANIARPIGKLDYLWLTLYLCYLILLLIIPPYFVIMLNVPFASTFIVLCEQLRIGMKIYGFFREIIPRAKAFKTAISHKSDDNVLGPPCPSFSKFLYFMFAPTLIYRDEYPRTKHINWIEVTKNAFQAVACWFSICFILTHFCIPEYQIFRSRHVTFKVLVRVIFNSMLPSVTCYVLNFFAVLHAWHNVSAELLRFGDRLFYRDWWNATNLASFYRDWNVIVHDWLYAYVYRDIQMVFGKKSSRCAALAVFYISAFFHEYIITVAMRFFCPVLFTLFFIGTVPILFLMKSAKRQSGNVFLWWAISVGNSINMCLYSLEAYSRFVCPQVYHNYLDVIIPRSWICLINGH